MYHIRDPASSDAFANPLDMFDPFQAFATLLTPVPALIGSLAPRAQAQGQVQQQQGSGWRSTWGIRVYWVGGGPGVEEGEEGPLDELCEHQTHAVKVLKT